jgi:hypothetical protein
MIKMYIENVKTAKGNWVDFPVDIEEMMENFEVENLGQLNVMDYEANFTNNRQGSSLLQMGEELPIVLWNKTIIFFKILVFIFSYGYNIIKEVKITI